MLKIIIFAMALLVEEEVFPEIDEPPQEILYCNEDTSKSALINDEYIFDAMGYIEFDDSKDLMEPYIGVEKR